CRSRRTTARHLAPSRLCYENAMTILKWLIILLVTGYAGLLAAMYVFQRALMYFPDPTRYAPALSGLPQGSEVSFRSSDGETLFAWYVAPGEGKPLIVYFHGNAGGLN